MVNNLEANIRKVKLIPVKWVLDCIHWNYWCTGHFESNHQLENISTSLGPWKRNIQRALSKEGSIGSWDVVKLMVWLKLTCIYWLLLDCIHWNYWCTGHFDSNHQLENISTSLGPWQRNIPRALSKEGSIGSWDVAKLMVWLKLTCIYWLQLHCTNQYILVTARLH